LRAKPVDDGDDCHRDACGDQAVFNGGGAGLILHDYLKMREYVEVAPGQFEIGRWGDLIGHLAGAPIFIERTLSDHDAWMTPMPEELKMHLYHVLLSHHGQMDWGSPVTPKTIEALIVHHLDNLDGKLSAAEETKDMTKNFAIGGRVVHLNKDAL